MTDLGIDIGRHDVEITFSELNVDISFTLTLDQFLDTLENILDDSDVSACVTKYVVRQAINKYEDEQVFSDNQALDAFTEQLNKVME